MIMKRLLSVVFCFCPCFALADGSYALVYHQSDLRLSCETSPALMDVEDSTGRRCNANLSKIPRSTVVSLKNQDGLDGLRIDIRDGGPQTYTVNLKGLSLGSARVEATGLLPTGEHFENTFSVLVSPGRLRKVDLIFDPEQKTLAVRRRVEIKDLAEEVDCARRLDWMTPHAGDYLGRFVRTAEMSDDGTHPQETRQLIQQFLFALGIKIEGCCGAEDLTHFVKEPALGILKEDAKSLLADLEKNPR